jgi:hypothetical protein
MLVISAQWVYKISGALTGLFVGKIDTKLWRCDLIKIPSALVYFLFMNAISRSISDIMSENINHELQKFTEPAGTAGHCTAA